MFHQPNAVSAMPTRTVIILSPYFPPSTLAGVHRARLLVKHLPLHGWNPILLCVDEAYHEQTLDPGLAALVPPERDIVKVPALPVGLTRLFGLGEISLRAWLPMRRKLFELLSTRRIDAVLITGAPFYPMLLASEITSRASVPVVLDFQDPWVSAWGAKQPLWSKSGLAHKLAVWLEPTAVRAADFITSVSDNQNADMAGRYPWLKREKMAAIPIGGDPTDFAHLRRNQVRSASGHLDPSKFNISFVGTIMPRSSEPLRALFRGLRYLIRKDPRIGTSIRINFIGTSNQPNDTRTYRVKPIADQEDVASAVYEVPQRLPYLEALTILANSDRLLLIGSDEPHYTASKIYPALMSGTPYLSLFHTQSSAHKILQQAGGGVALSFDTTEALTGMTASLADGLRRLVSDPQGLSLADPAAYAAYEGDAIAGAYGAIFDRLSLPR